MICMAYLVLHGAIWLALSEQRNTQVRLWCISGLISGLSVVILSLRYEVGEFIFHVCRAAFDANRKCRETDSNKNVPKQAVRACYGCTLHSRYSVFSLFY